MANGRENQSSLKKYLKKYLFCTKSMRVGSGRSACSFVDKKKLAGMVASVREKEYR